MSLTALRRWLFDVLTAAGLGPVYGAGSLDRHPGRVPFLTVLFGTDAISLTGDDRDVGRTVDVDVWCHDDPGTLTRVDDRLDAVRATLLTAAYPRDLVGVRFRGRSGDAPDEMLGTVKKFETVGLVRRMA